MGTALSEPPQRLVWTATRMRRRMPNVRCQGWQTSGPQKHPEQGFLSLRLPSLMPNLSLRPWRMPRDLPQSPCETMPAPSQSLQRKGFQKALGQALVLLQPRPLRARTSAARARATGGRVCRHIVIQAKHLLDMLAG